MPAPTGPAVRPRQDTPPRPGHLTWSAADGGLQTLAVWTERRPGHGEDAEPLAAHHRPTGSGLLAVFDGSGGSGAAPGWREPDGTTHTSAWTGARIARLAAECWFQHAVAPEEAASGGNGPGSADSPERLKHWLRRMLDAAPTVARSKITGSMRRVLPTTLAAIRYETAAGGVRWEAVWAGDSRSYALLPGSGLHALTRDDTHEDDALAQLRQDPPMTNVVCADREFTLSAHRGEFGAPCVLLTATDGFFGYVHTPAQFECVLLDTLAHAVDAADWAERLRRAIQPATGDDASLSLAALGFEDFGRLRAAFAGRRADLARGEYLDVPPEDDQEAMRGWQDRTWQAYRDAYETFMPGVRE